MPPVRDIINVSTGNFNGADDNYHPIVIGTDIGKNEPVNQKPEIMELLVQSEPEFPGGTQALAKLFDQEPPGS